jgi:hypothetical protein
MDPRQKNFRLDRSALKELITPMGGCYASDRILVDGEKVGYMFRESPTESAASGWTFMAGDEDQDYADDPDHWAIYEVNTVCNYDPSIIPYLDSEVGSAFGRDAGADDFQREPMPSEPPE